MGLLHMGTPECGLDIQKSVAGYRVFRDGSYFEDKRLRVYRRTLEDPYPPLGQFFINRFVFGRIASSFGTFSVLFSNTYPTVLGPSSMRFSLPRDSLYRFPLPKTPDVYETIEYDGPPISRSL